MDSIQDILISVVMELVRVILIIEYFQIFFEKVHLYKKVIAGAVSYIITTGCYLGFHNSLINIISTIIGMFIIAAVHEGTLKKKILHTVMCFGVSCAMDMLAGFALMEAPSSSNYVLFSSFLSVVMFYAFVVILRNIYRKRNREEFSGQWVFLLLIVLMSICVAYVLLNDNEISRVTALTVIIVMIAVNLILYYFYTSMLDRYIFMQDNVLLREQIAIYESELRANMEQDRNVQALRHDMKHHIREIYSLADKNTDTDIIRYLDEMSDSMDNIEKVASTGNSVFDGILNYYAQKIKQEMNNVNFSVTLKIPTDLEISSFDMNVILGNLLDNAMENVSGEAGQELQIEAVLEYIEGLLRIEVVNTFAGNVNKDGERFISHKGQGHGFGLFNVKKITEKYSGYMMIEHESNRFKVVVLLYL
jgi:two-component system sensor histidine kinase AgrC